MLNEIQILNNGYPMPSVGLGVYKISDEDMTKVVNAAIDAGIERLIQHTFMIMRLH